MQKSITIIYTNDEISFYELRYSNSSKSYKKHFHSTFSLGIMKIGQREYFNKENTYLLNKNKVSILNPNTVHSCNPYDTLKSEYFMLYLDKDWCMNIQKLIDNKINSFVDVPVDILENEKIYNEYLTLCEFLKEDNHYLDKEDELIKFFIQFFALFLDNKKETIKEDNNFKLLINYFEEHYKENISLDNLSEKFSLNPFYIIKLFKMHTNLTPHSYLLNLKINKSKELLKKQYSIVDTALECGFFDQSHFHKNFLKIVASTPNEYKLNFVQDEKQKLL